MNRKLSPAQVRMLQQITDTGEPLAHLRGRSRSELGGGERTMRALIREHLIYTRTTRGRSRWYLSRAGCAALARAIAKPEPVAFCTLTEKQARAWAGR